MQSVRIPVEPTPEELRAAASRLEAQAREVEARTQIAEVPPPVPLRVASLLEAPVRRPMAPTGHDKIAARARARRRRRNRVSAFSERFFGLLRALLVGTFAGLAMYLLAMATVVRLVDESRVPHPKSPPVTQTAP